MQSTWNLNEFFKDSNDFYNEIQKIKDKVTEIKKYKNKKYDEILLLKLLDEKWKIKERTNSILIYGSLMYYKNTKEDECIKLKNIAEKFHNQVDSDLLFIDQKIINIGERTINKYIRKNPKLKIYQQALNDLFRKQKHIQDETTNITIKENINKINSQIDLYNNILRDITYGEIEINNKKVEITASNVSKYLSSRDRKTRSQVYLNVNQNFKAEKEKFANILDLIFGYRIQNAKLENYNSVLEKVLFDENINPKIIDTLIKTVNSNLKLNQKYLKIKANILNISNPHLYDFEVPLDKNLKIKYTYEEAINIIKKALKPLGKEYLAVIDKLLNGHIDAIPEENKHQSIIFSWNTYSFMNYKEEYTDLKNLIHELGHIVNYYLSKEKVPFIYEDSTIFIGETASIVNEILLTKYLYENAKTNEEKIFYLSKEIENYFTSVFKQTMYTEFENELYNTKLTKTLSAEILSEKYNQIIRKYYGDDIIYDEESKIEWTRLGHIYRWSYYPYKYATGLLIASVVVNSLLNKTLSEKQYLEFLSLGSSLYSLDLLKKINIDLIDSNIIATGFKVMEKDIEKLEKY